MMLVSERSADGIRERLYACLPHPDIAAVFGGFEPITESDLPLTATLLVGNQTEFAKQFGYSSH